MTTSQKKLKNHDPLSLRLTRWVGSTSSLIVHTCFFVFAFLLGVLGVAWDKVFLVLTTVVSLEAIYLSIFIQMSVNRNTESLRDVEENLDVIEENIDEIQEDVDEIQKDIDEIQEDVDEISEEEKEEETQEKAEQLVLEKIRTDLARLVSDIEKLKK
jgi:uncharacterized membrane protein